MYEGRKAPSENVNRPTVAAVIPLYNGARFIESAIRSVLAQTVPPNEIFVVDDGSTDDGPEIVRRLSHTGSIRLVQKPNGGQGSARNRGVAESDGDLIAFLDQDDMWYPRHIERLLEPFVHSADANIGWVYCNLDEVDEDGLMVTLNVLDYTKADHPKRSLAGCLGRDMFILPSASMVSRVAFLAVGGFDERLRGYEDDDLFLRMFRSGYRNVYVDEALSKWRIFAGSSSFSPTMAKSRMIYFDKLMENYPDCSGTGRRYRQDLITPRFVRMVLDDYIAGLRANDPVRVRRSVGDLSTLVPHLSRKRRLASTAALPFMRSRRLGRSLDALGLARIPARLLR